MSDLNHLYAPRSGADDRGGGYRIRSEATWDLARDAYLAGATAEDVCVRFDLSEGTFRERAKKGGWRRCDQADPPPFTDGPVDWSPTAADDVDDDADYGELADHALRQLRRAMARGRASAAASWMRLHERLTAKAEAARAEAEAAARRAAAPSGPPSIAHEKLTERLEAQRREARTYVARRDGASALELAASVAARVGDLARRVVATDPRDSVSRAMLDQEMNRLYDEVMDGIPDDPDDPDAVFTDPPPPP